MTSRFRPTTVDRRGAPRRLRRAVALLAVLAASGCGDDGSDVPKGIKAARVTVGDTTCKMRTDGYTFSAGKLPIQITNKTQADAEVAFHAGSERKATVENTFLTLTVS